MINLKRQNGIEFCGMVADCPSRIFGGAEQMCTAAPACLAGPALPPPATLWHTRALLCTLQLETFPARADTAGAPFREPRTAVSASIPPASAGGCWPRRDGAQRARGPLQGEARRICKAGLLCWLLPSPEADIIAPLSSAPRAL